MRAWIIAAATAATLVIAPAASADATTPPTLRAPGDGSGMVRPDIASLSVTVTRSADRPPEAGSKQRGPVCGPGSERTGAALHHSGDQDRGPIMLAAGIPEKQAHPHTLRDTFGRLYMAAPRAGRRSRIAIGTSSVRFALDVGRRSRRRRGRGLLCYGCL